MGSLAQEIRTSDIEKKGWVCCAQEIQTSDIEKKVGFVEPKRFKAQTLKKKKAGFDEPKRFERQT